MYITNKLINNLHWYVYNYDINKDKIKIVDIFNTSSRFRESFDNAINEYKKTKDIKQFENNVKSALMYAYGSKCEYEVVLKPFVPTSSRCEKKIDIYEQVNLNFFGFIHYIETTLKILGEQK